MESENETNFFVVLTGLFFNSLIYCQSFGISAGYGFLDMNEVNKNLDNIRNEYSNFPGFISSTEITGGFLASKTSLI